MSVVAYSWPILAGVRRRFRPPSDRATPGKVDPRYVYALWLRTAQGLKDLGCPQPRTIVELGPGNSLGLGIASLLAGAVSYTGLDIRPYASLENDLAVLESLTRLFAADETMPTAAEFPRVYPRPRLNTRPSEVLGTRQLAAAIAPERVESVARLVRARGTGPSSISGLQLKYEVPWRLGELQQGHANLVFSQAVLQSIPEEVLPKVLAETRRILAPGGVAIHQIDLGFALDGRRWNYHRAYGDFAWRMLDYRREYTVNRLPLSAYLDLVRQEGFTVRQLVLERGDGGLARHEVARPFRTLSDQDFHTHGAFLVLTT